MENNWGSSQTNPDNMVLRDGIIRATVGLSHEGWWWVVYDGDDKVASGVRPSREQAQAVAEAAFDAPIDRPNFKRIHYPLSASLSLVHPESSLYCCFHNSLLATLHPS